MGRLDCRERPPLARRGSGLFALSRHRRRRSVTALEARPFLLHGGANLAHVRARRVELTRFGGDVNADRAVEAVRLPRRDVAFFIAVGDEAIVIPLVPAALAAAEA